MDEKVYIFESLLYAHYYLIYNIIYKCLKMIYCFMMRSIYYMFFNIIDGFTYGWEESTSQRNKRHLRSSRT